MKLLKTCLIGLLMSAPLLATPFDEKKKVQVDGRKDSSTVSQLAVTPSDAPLVKKAQSARKIDEFVRLAKGCEDWNDADRILLMGLKYAKTDADFHKLFEGCTSFDARERVINAATDASISPTFSPSKQAPAAKKEQPAPKKERVSIQDRILLFKAQSAQKVDDFVRLAAGCEDKKVADRILVQGIKYARSEADFHVLFEGCIGFDAREKVINAATDFKIAPMFK